MGQSIGVGQDEAPTKAAPDLVAEVERNESPDKGRAQAVVAFECRPA
jgi:hypothetical protein